MKFLSLVPLLAVAYAAESAVEDVAAEKPNLDMSANGVKILPRFESTKPTDGGQRTTITYGTYSVTKSKMLSTLKLAKGPCPMTGCYVTAMQATIRYPDKREANIDSDAWLHHIALFGSGGGQGSLWACGNERPTLRLNNEGRKYGLDFPQSYMLMIDLMTESSTPKSLTMEITYEWVPKMTAGYKAVNMYWLTIGEPAAKSGIYKFTSLSSTATINGELLYAIGHMHDGGSDMRLFLNRDSKPVCKSIMHYNLRPGYTPPGGKGMGGMSHSGHNVVAPGAPDAANLSRRDGGGGMDHISDPGACTNFGSVKAGDKLWSEAWYDAIAHPLMEHNGKKENLMGNMRVYVGPK